MRFEAHKTATMKSDLRVEEFVVARRLARLLKVYADDCHFELKNVGQVIS